MLFTEWLNAICWMIKCHFKVQEKYTLTLLNPRIEDSFLHIFIQPITQHWTKKQHHLRVQVHTRQTDWLFVLSWIFRLFSFSFYYYSRISYIPITKCSTTTSTKNNRWIFKWIFRYLEFSSFIFNVLHNCTYIQCVVYE